jgi:predicted enzyme related to lactoylglutathione lyase
MVTVQVRDFDGVVAWYRDVLGLGIGWLEAGEFCTLTMPGGEAVLAVATDHPDRISDRPGTGWTPTLTVDDLDEMVSRLVTRACSLMPRRRAQTRDTGWCACVTPRATPSG